MTSGFTGTKCFQMSGRDDQKQNIFGVGDGFGLPAFVWHQSTQLPNQSYAQIESAVVPWSAKYRPDPTGGGTGCTGRGEASEGQP